MATRARWTLVTLPIAAALLAAAALPLTSAQGDPPQDGIVLADGHAEGRFVAFDVGGGAVCGWSFEGRTVIDAMVGVGGQARTQGRSVVVDGAADADASGACAAASVADGEDRDGAGEAGPDDQPGEDGGGAEGNATGNGTASSSATTTSPPRASARAHLHDNPSGIITLDLDAGETVHIDFDAGLALRAQGGKVVVEGDGLRATLFASGGGDDGLDVRVDGRTVSVHASTDARVHFRVGDGDLGEDDDEDVEEHVDDGDVACEVFVTDDGAPHVVAIEHANVSVAAVHTSVRVDLDIDIDVDVDVGSGSTTTVTASPTRTQTQTVTQTQTQTATTTTTATRTTTTSAGGGDGGATTTSSAGAGCGCASTVLILDVDVTVLVLDADDDLLVRLNGDLLARADSVDDALHVEAGEDPEALVVVDQQQEVKVLLSLAEGRNQVTMERQDGEQFQTREPVRYTRTTTLAPGDDGFVGVDDVSVDGQGEADGTSDGGGADVSVPGFGWGLALAAVVVAGLVAARRRLE